MSSKILWHEIAPANGADSDFRVDYIEVPGNGYADGPSPFPFRLPEQENLWEYYFTILDRLRKYIDIPINIAIEGFASEDVPQSVCSSKVNRINYPGRYFITS